MYVQRMGRLSFSVHKFKIVSNYIAAGISYLTTFSWFTIMAYMYVLRQEQREYLSELFNCCSRHTTTLRSQRDDKMPPMATKW